MTADEILKEIFSTGLHDDLFGICFKIAGENLADDAFQNALITVWRKAEQFRGECALSSWLYMIFRSESLMLIRAERRHTRPEASEARWKYYARLREEQDRAECQYSKLKQAEIVKKADVVIDSYFYGGDKCLSHKDFLHLVDNEMGLTEFVKKKSLKINAAKSCLHRLRMQLRKELGFYLDEAA
jgi:RNA polymerase sigma factor (sigma-70 family)